MQTVKQPFTYESQYSTCTRRVLKICWHMALEFPIIEGQMFSFAPNPFLTNAQHKNIEISSDQWEDMPDGGHCTELMGCLS